MWSLPCGATLHACFNVAATLELRKAPAPHSCPPSSRRFNVAATLELRKARTPNASHSRQSRLQCGRNFRVAEGGTRARAPQSGARFNVAATLELRKGCGPFPDNANSRRLQCGRNFRVAEGQSSSVEVRIAHVLQCGRNFRVAEGYSRVSNDMQEASFNVAATLELRKATR